MLGAGHSREGVKHLMLSREKRESQLADSSVFGLCMLTPDTTQNIIRGCLEEVGRPRRSSRFPDVAPSRGPYPGGRDGLGYPPTWMVEAPKARIWLLSPDNCLTRKSRDSLDIPTAYDQPVHDWARNARVTGSDPRARWQSP